MLEKWITKYTGILRSLRVTYWMFNLTNLTKLKKNKSAYKQFGIKKQVWQSLSHEDIKNSSGDIPWMDKRGITKEQIKAHPLFEGFSEIIQQGLLQWPEKGYLVVPEFFNKEVNLINAEIEKLLGQDKISFNFTGRKIMDAWKQSELINAVFKHPEILKLMNFIFGKDV